MNVLVAQMYPTLCDPMDCENRALPRECTGRRKHPGFPCPWDSPGKNTRVGSHSLLQGIFPTQGSNPGLLRCRCSKLLNYLTFL